MATKESECFRPERIIIGEVEILQENARIPYENFEIHHSFRKESVPIQELASDFRLFL